MEERKASTVRQITRVAWGLLALTNVILLFGMQGLLLCLQLPLLGLLFIVLVWLLVRYNRPLAQWRAVGLIWFSYTVLRWLSLELHASGVPFLQGNMAAFAMLLAVEAMLAGWFALLALAVRRDVSLVYIVMFFVIGAPLLRALVMKAGGVLSFLFGQAAEGPFDRFSISEPLVMSLSCMATLGFIAFLPHLMWLLIKELRGY